MSPVNKLFNPAGRRNHHKRPEILFFFKNNNRTGIDLLLMECTKIQTAYPC